MHAARIYYSFVIDTNSKKKKIKLPPATPLSPCKCVHNSKQDISFTHTGMENYLEIINCCTLEKLGKSKDTPRPLIFIQDQITELVFPVFDKLAADLLYIWQINPY